MMKAPPPYLVRRLLICPLILVLALLAITLLPVWLLVAAFVSRFVPGRWRPLRILWFFFLYLELEALMILVLFALWVASGFGAGLRSPRMVALHYRVAGWWLRRVMGSARRTFTLTTEVDSRSMPVERDGPLRPLLMFSRHAGPGDSFLLVDAVLNGVGRRPRIVLKETLRLDPCLDIALGRVPCAFVPGGRRAGAQIVENIGRLAGTMGPADALVLFPEGGNFTVGRHAAAIERLDEIGRPDLADRARAMRHLLPPKPTGAVTAIEAAPSADVVFVGHVGLEKLVTVRDVWRGLPMDAAVRARTWVVRAEDVPEPTDREAWLYDQWAAIDEWIAEELAQRRTADGAEPTGE